jgi:hypothetical protein
MAMNGRLFFHIRDWPRLLESTTTMAQATRMRWSGRVRPKGVLRTLGSLTTWLGQTQRIWASLKKHLEAPLAQGLGGAG